MWRNLIVVVGFIVGCISMGFVVLKTRSDVMDRTSDRWTGGNSQAWIDDFVAGNASLGLNIPDGRAIVRGERGVYMPKAVPTPSLASQSATVRFSWESGPVGVGLDSTGDGSEPFYDRAIAGYKYVSKSVPPTAKR